KQSDIDPVNQRNLKALDNGGTATYWQKSKVVAIGAGHRKDLMDDLQDGGATGKVSITKGGLTGPGSLEVTGCRNRREFEDSIKRISKKKVVFK
ncbi:MAG: hypothetical protein KGN36_01975, partial [Acidobacteriota bacterium]|nr:hypothetical protein [Acidobacteriota bacterium]